MLYNKEIQELEEALVRINEALEMALRLVREAKLLSLKCSVYQPPAVTDEQLATFIKGLRG